MGASFKCHLGNYHVWKPTSALIRIFIKYYDNTYEQGNNVPGDATKKRKRQRLEKDIEGVTFHMGLKR